MMKKSATINVRIDPELKKDAESILAQVGLNVSNAIELFYRNVVLNRGIPFEVKIPNELTLATFRKMDAGEDLHEFSSLQEILEKDSLWDGEGSPPPGNSDEI